MKFATKTYNITHLTLACRYTTMRNYKFKFSADIQLIWKKMQTNCIFIPSTFVIHPQILIFSVFKIPSFSPY